MGRAHLTRSARVFLTGLIDYAGLFPPASLSMAEAVRRWARYRSGPHDWMLARFIVPCVRLQEFEEAALPLLSERDAAAAGATGGLWRLSVLGGGEPAADAEIISAYNARHLDAGLSVIDAIEMKCDAAADIARAASVLLPWGTLWFEVAPGPALRPMLDAIKQIGPRAGAKLRTGGVTPDAIPAAASVTEFLLACARAGVPCKMTAGLHHPVHAPHRLTYADDSPTALMHGFVNVFLAAVLARALMQRGREDVDIRPLLLALLGERDAHRITWHEDHVTWRGHQLDIEAIASARGFARSFGSCSFDEPVEDLTQLGWL